MSKKIKVLYFTAPIATLMAMGAVHYLFSSNKELLPFLPPETLYYIRVLVQLFTLGTILGAFTFFRNRHDFMIGGVCLSCLFIVYDYYLHTNMPDQANLLNNLYILAILYVWKFFFIIKRPNNESNQQ